MLVKKQILNNDNIVRILTFYNYHNIEDKGNEVRCGISETSNPTSICVIKDDNLTACDFARNITGDIFTLIMENRNLSFREVIHDVRDVLNINVEFKKKEENGSVSEIYSDLIFKDKEEIAVYEDSILDSYDNCWNTRFLEDGISISTQKKFEIMYDSETERIVIPHRDQYGDLCGVIGRTNIDDYTGSKYLPLLAFKKSKILYGYSHNYNRLYKADTIYIGEAEKFVMQLDSMGCSNAVALSGSSISKDQILLLAKLMPKRVVFCMDEGLDILAIYRNVNKFRYFTDRLDIEVGAVIDRENKFLRKGSKESPTDLGIDVWRRLINECYEEL